MGLYAHPAMIGAIGTENTDILEYIKGYIDKKTILEEMYEQYGDEMNWPESLKTFLRL
jgi:hypothetical protein